MKYRFGSQILRVYSPYCLSSSCQPVCDSNAFWEGNCDFNDAAKSFVRDEYAYADVEVRIQLNISTRCTWPLTDKRKV